MIRVLLLENVHKATIDLFENKGFKVETLKSALNEAELCDKLPGIHILGIRSKTRITEKCLEKADCLLAIGCFCIGIDQCDLSATEKLGIPIFNSPFCSSRSVAELMIGWIISLSRKFTYRSIQMHKGVWEKSATNSYEIRGKKLGIIGYGHIGSQLSILAESMGLHVLYYDIIKTLALGNAQPVDSLSELLQQADFVTCHVPKNEDTDNMIGAPQLAEMKKGAYLLNASRGTVIDIPALAQALRSGQLAGAAIDVYPIEPESNTENWVSELQGLENVILTPHIGGSTEEAQEAIALDVGDKIIKFISNGSTLGAVNFPNCEITFGGPNTHRILNIHENKPGVLKEINTVLASANVRAQMLATTDFVGYIIIDVDHTCSASVKYAIQSIPGSIRTRIVY